MWNHAYIQCHVCACRCVSIHIMLTGFFKKLSWIGGSNPVTLFPTTEAARMIPPTSEKLLFLLRNKESVRNTDWVNRVPFVEALRLKNNELGSDNDAIASSVSEKDKLFMSNCKLVLSKPLVTNKLKGRPADKRSGSTSCTTTANDSRVKTTCVSFSGMGMLSVTCSIDSLRLWG